MLSMLRQISIQKRLMALVGVSAILMMVGTWISSLSQRSTLMDDRRTQVQRLVEVAVGTLTHFHAQAQSGTLSEEDARAAALTVIGQLRYGDNDYFWVNDLQSRMVMHPIMAKLNGQDMSDLKDPNGVYLFREMLKVVKTPEKSGFVDYAWPKPGHEQPVPKTSFVKLFEPWGWVIGSGIYIDDVDATFRAITLRHGVLVILGIGVLVVLSLIVGLSVVRPLRQTVAALEDIAHGEGDLTRTLPDGGRDEVSQLAQAFNTFSGKIRTLVQQVQGVARSNADITRDVSATVAQAEDSTGHQKAELDTVAAAVEQMVATSQEVSERILAAAEAAQEANGQSLQGRNRIDQTVSAMQQLAQNLTRSVSALRVLEQDSQAIGSVVDVIRGVAEQTNLLALNAAIEAARAGEQGRGFAVVADEVRTLASRTQASTDEIHGIIARLQQGARQAVDAMQVSEQDAGAMLTQVADTEQALALIGGAVEQISAMTSHVATASEEQTQTAGEISQRLNNIATLGDEVLSQLKGTRQITQSLTETSARLDGLVDQFRTG